MTSGGWTMEAVCPKVTLARIPIPTPVHEWSQSLLLTSDWHWDNPTCRRDLLKRHLSEAMERNALVCCFGDLFCAMQGKYDKRSNKAAVRPEHQNDRYLDSLVDTAAEWLAPYAKCLGLLSTGNHESSIASRHETNLLDRLCGKLRSEHGSQVVAGAYSGWLRFMFTRHRQQFSRTLWYHHGYGGGGPVTKDTIQSNRQKVYVDGADFMCTGHTHDRWVDEKTTELLSQSNREERRSLWYLKCGAYKDAVTGKGHGFEIERGHPPKALGGWWVDFTLHGKALETRIRSA